MKKLIYLFSIILFFTLTSCETVVEIDLPEQDSKIVVNSFISTDSLFSIHISKSIGALESKAHSVIYTAKVNLYEDDVFVEELKLNNQGFYTTVSFKPKAGKMYKIEASANNYESISASTKVPNPTAISDISFKDSAFQQTSQFDPSYKEWNSQINFSFNDDPNETNYYSFQVIQGIPIFDTLGNNIGSQFFETQSSTNDPNFETFNHIMNDELINGTNYKTSVNVPSYTFSDSLTSVYFVFYSISKETYLYKKTLAKYYDSNGNPFAEPVRVYNNIENGIGIFGSTSSSIKKIK